MATSEFDKTGPVLITGAGGFVGKNLVATLRAAGYTDLLLFEKDDTPATLASKRMLRSAGVTVRHLETELSSLTLDFHKK